MAAQPRHLHRLLAFFDPLLRRASLVVETDHSPTVRPQVGHDEIGLGEHLPNWNSTFTTTGRAVFHSPFGMKPLYLTTVFGSVFLQAALTTHDVPLYAFICRDANSTPHSRSSSAS